MYYYNYNCNVQYIEAKNVLKDYFDEIINELYQESHSLRFNVELPLPGGNNHNNHNLQHVHVQENSKHKYIPESLIARELRSKLDEIRKNSNSNNKENINNSNSQSESESELEYEAIIDAFGKLYSKYVDSDSAWFMINISSKNRNSWSKQFDKNNNQNNAYNNNTNNNMNGIVHELENQIYNNGSDVQGNEKTCKWLLKLILQTTDPSAREIAHLLNGSFSRFRKIHQNVYQEFEKMANHM